MDYKDKGEKQRPSTACAIDGLVVPAGIYPTKRQQSRCVWLKRYVATFLGTDADDFLKRHDEDLAVADFTGFGSLGDGIDGLGYEVTIDRDFEFYLRKEIDRVFAAAVDFGVTFLTAEAFDFGHGHAFDTDLGEGVFNFLEFERLDDCDDEFHEFWKRVLIIGSF